MSDELKMVLQCGKSNGDGEDVEVTKHQGCSTG